MELSLLLVCIRKSYIVYLEIYVVPIGHGFSFFGHGKSMLKKRGHPAFHGLASQRSQFWYHHISFPHVLWCSLRGNDQIRHDNTYGEGLVVFRGSDTSLHVAQCIALFVSHPRSVEGWPQQCGSSFSIVFCCPLLKYISVHWTTFILGLSGGGNFPQISEIPTKWRDWTEVFVCITVTSKTHLPASPKIHF